MSVNQIQDKSSVQSEVVHVKESSKKSTLYSILAFLGFIGVTASIVMGFYKMLVYENPDSYLLDSKNVHVGGDAYNYIINGTHTTAYFVLALVCMVFTCTMLVLNEMNTKG
ncbi:hypothetical protein MKX47_11750 [Solibacillus sp. FSL R7-0668]|uniref:hypothetical protein n=1 Tax=Solibacillus sp. FSL R7-0668 TaxID=2921688 RepID=UPI0030F9870E